MTPQSAPPNQDDFRKARRDIDYDVWQNRAYASGTWAITAFTACYGHGSSSLEAVSVTISTTTTCLHPHLHIFYFSCTLTLLLSPRLGRFVLTYSLPPSLLDLLRLPSY